MADISQAELIPTVRPREDAPTPIFRPDVSPAAFGGAVAKGTEELGGSLSKVGTTFGQLAADDVANDFVSSTEKLLHGDPNKMIANPDGTTTQDVGFLGLKGRKALDERKAYSDNLERVYKEARGKMRTPEQLNRFENITRRFRDVTLSKFGTHADTQQNLYGVEVQKGRLANSVTAIARDPLDQDGFNHAMADMVDAHTKAAELSGAQKGDPAWVAAQQLGRQQAIKARILAIGATNAPLAAQLTEQDKGELGPDYHVLADHFRSRAETEGADAVGVGVFRAVTTGQQPAGPPNENNIGNVRPKGGDANSGFVKVSSFDEGVKLAVNNARAYPEAFNAGRPMSINQIGEHWTATDKEAWKKNVAAGSGLPANEPLDLNNPEIAARIAKGIHTAEWGAAKTRPLADYSKGLTQVADAGPQATNAPPDIKDPEGSKARFARQAEEGIRRIDEMNLPPKQYLQAVNAFRASMAAHEMAENAKTQAKTEDYHKALGGYVDDMVGGNFAGMVQKIAQDPRIPPEHKMPLIEMARHQSGNPQSVATFGPGWQKAFEGVMKKPGDPGYIGDASEIIKMGPGGTGELSAAGVADVLKTRALAMKDIDQHGIQETRSHMMKWAYSQLVVDHEALFPGMAPRKDKRGEDAYDGAFVPKVNAAYAAFMAKPGANPLEFWTQENMQKLMEGVRSKSDLALERLGGQPQQEKPGAPLPPPPAGVPAGSWNALMNQVPLTEGGKPIAHDQWARSLQYLKDHPTPETIKAFNKTFEAGGYDGAEILRRFSTPPAASVPIPPPVANPDLEGAKIERRRAPASPTEGLE